MHIFKHLMCLQWQFIIFIYYLAAILDTILAAIYDNDQPKLKANISLTTLRLKKYLKSNVHMQLPTTILLLIAVINLNECTGGHIGCHLEFSPNLYIKSRHPTRFCKSTLNATSTHIFKHLLCLLWQFTIFIYYLAAILDAILDLSRHRPLRSGTPTLTYCIDHQLRVCQFWCLFPSGNDMPLFMPYRTGLLSIIKKQSNTINTMLYCHF